MKDTSIKKNIILSTMYQILTLITPFITTPYISRVLGAGGIGIYSYTNSIQTYFSLFAALGTAAYGAREIAIHRNDEYQRSKLFWEIELLAICTSTICILLWGGVIAFSSTYKIYYLILTLNLFSTMFDISWFYTGLEQFKYTIVKNAIFKILGIISLFIFIKDAGDLTLYILISCLTTLLGTLSMWFYLPKFLKKVKLKDLKILPHLKETLIYFVPTIATSIYTVLDKTLIGVITENEEENGYYEQATKIINMCKTITFVALNSVLGSRISYLFAEKKYDEIHKRIDTSINYILFIGIGIMFGLLGVSDLFVVLFFGADYARVGTLLKVLSPLALIIGISNCLGSQYYTPAGYRSKSAKFIIAGSVINLILNLILIPKLWGTGASIATLIAELTITILYLKFCDGYLTVKKLIKFGWKKLISGAVMLLAIYLIGLLNINSIILLIMQVAIGSITYGIVLLILKDDFAFSMIERMKNMWLNLRKNKLGHTN